MNILLSSLGDDFQQFNRSVGDNSVGSFTTSSSSHGLGALLMDGSGDNYMVTSPEHLTAASANVTSQPSLRPPPDTTIGLCKFVVWGVLGSTLAILGFLGNTLSMVVLHRRQMRSSTSYYLLSLAIYDNGILLGMMLYFCLPALIPYVTFLNDYRTFMSFSLPYGYPFSLSAQMGSIYTCVGFTVERFIAVCRPLHAANTCTRSRTIRAIIVIFIWSVVYNIPRFFQYKVKYDTEIITPSLNNTSKDINSYAGPICSESHDLNSNFTPPQSNITSNKCFINVIFNVSDSILKQDISETFQNLNSSSLLANESSEPSVRRIASHQETEFGSNPTFRHLYLIYFQLFFMFLLPFVIILIMNIGLIRAVRKSRSMQMSMCTSAKKEHNLTVMLIAVIVVFLVCQFPTIIDNILVAVVRESTLRGNKAYMVSILCLRKFSDYYFSVLDEGNHVNCTVTVKQSCPALDKTIITSTKTV